MPDERRRRFEEGISNPWFSIIGFVLFTAIISYNLHVIHNDQEVAAAAARYAANLAAVVARNQVAAHDADVKSCMARRGMRLHSAKLDRLQAENDRELAAASQTKRFHDAFMRRSAIEDSRAADLERNAGDMCSVMFQVPKNAKVLK